MDKTSRKSRELKGELQRLVNEIIGDSEDGEAEGREEFNVEIVDEAIQTLYSLRHELKLNQERRELGASQLDDLVVVPDEYRCPISKELMRDPVILDTGRTYDRVFIQGWLEGGNRTCPQTQHVLSHTVLTYNHLVRELIARWCKDHGIEIPPPDDGAITDSDRSRLKELLAKLSFSSSLEDNKEAAKELRALTKKLPSFRSLFGESPDTLTQLLGPLRHEPPRVVDHDLQEDLVTIILNLSITERNKKIAGEHPRVIRLLIESLQSHGTIGTRRNAAAALFSLAVLESNQVLEAEAGAIRPLLDLLGEDDTEAVKDAASALYKLCTSTEIREKVIQEGAVEVVMKKIKNGVLVDELLVVLALLSTENGAVEEMVEHGAVACLLEIMRESRLDETKENSVATLYSIVTRHRASLKEVRAEEITHRTLSLLEQNGKERAKRKAKGILNRLDRSFSLHRTP